MPGLNFDHCVNSISGEQQLSYLKAVLVAAEKYLAWLKENTQGIRYLTRFSHFFHGASGESRALQIKKFLQEAAGIELALDRQSLDARNPEGFFKNAVANPKSFLEIIRGVAECWRESGYHNHSLRLFMYSELTKQPNVIFDDFKETSNTFITTKLARFVEPIAGSGISPLEQLDFWSLTHLVKQAEYLPYENFSALTRQEKTFKGFLQALHAVRVDEILAAMDAEIMQSAFNNVHNHHPLLIS